MAVVRWLCVGAGLALGAAVGLSGLPSDAVVSPAQADDELAPERPFDPDVVRPQSGSTLEAVLRARRAGQLEAARSLAVAAISDAPFEHAARLRWLAAQITRELEQPHEAADLLLPVATSEHPLAFWARYNVAEWLESKDPGRALALLDSLLAPVSDLERWPGKIAAERLRARVLDKLGRREEAVAAFERFVSELPDEALAVQVVVPLADMLSQGDENDRVRALALYRRVAHGVPRSRVGIRCEEMAREMLKSLPEPLRSEYKEPSLEDQLLRADALLASLRYDDARDAYAKLEKLAAEDQALLCRARYGRAKALLDRRSRDEGSALMAMVAEECDQDADRRAWARYYAARAYSAIGKNELALAQYEALEREAPDHRLADDALYRSAKLARDMGDVEGVFERLKALPERYPQGDMQARARFTLAWEAFTQRDFTRAIATLAEEQRDEAAEDVQGRAAYWYARFLLEAGRNKEAATAFAAAFARTPLSYYGQQAYARLKALDPGRAQGLLASISHGSAPKLTFERRPELENPGFARAVELFSVGELNLGLNELRALGFLSEEADSELVFLAAALVDRAGAQHTALDVARRRMAALLGRAPSGRDRALYELVYPLAYAPLIEQVARKESVPSSFIRAVAREESGFFPRAVSRAHAYGLIQMIEPTAKAVAKGLKLPHDVQSLMRPEINLALGARFISNLALNLRGQLPLVPAAYNAGPAAAARWLSERQHEPFDVWVENIPYDETRHYTRRVIQTYGVYHWLATGQMLQLPGALPRGT